MHENRSYLSELDGKIGDGDHGINMDKGFALAAGRLEDDASLSDALRVLGRTLVMEIGGSMGPLYGQMFKAMARACKEVEEVDADVVLAMLDAAYGAIRELGEAKVGDKTLVDTLDPAVGALRAAVEAGKALPDALDDMVAAAEAGWKSTEELVAKIGRSSRLGERSRGVLDAGATSCFFMLSAMAGEMKELAS
jgi:dihydroxyacetone kinase-like protein